MKKNISIEVVTPSNPWTEFFSASGSNYVRGKDPLYSAIHEGARKIRSASEEAAILAVLDDGRFNDRRGRAICFWEFGWVVMDGDKAVGHYDCREDAEEFAAD